MIASSINTHVGSLRHMTVNTLGLRTAMTSVLFYIIVSRIMALPTKTVIGVFKGTAVRIETIHAGNSFLIHTTLHKGSDHEHLIIDLTIGKIQALFQQTDDHRPPQKPSGPAPSGKSLAHIASP